MLICKHCQKQLDSLDSLRIHCAKAHKLSSKEVYDLYFTKGERPKCKCGCGEDVPFRTLQKGYAEWIRGHISRVKNNWGHNKKAIDNSSKTRRNQFKNGERKVWNDGLNKESDERIKYYAEKGSNTIKSNKNEIKRRSIWLSDARKNKKEFKSKYGKESANWKGGTSSINNLVRANKRLYTDWIYPILCRDGFKCIKCGSSHKLEVHHSKETMSEILKHYVEKDCEYTFDEKREIMNKVIDYHISNEVEGETLCKNCHTQLHPSYNI